MSSYDDWKTDPEYGMSNRDLLEAEMRAELHAAQEENDKLRAKVDNLTDMLEEILEYCQDNYDVDPDPSGGHHDVPNWYMRTGTEIEEVLGRGGRYGGF